MIQLRLIAKFPANRKKLLKVELLPLIGNVDNLVRAKLFNARGHRGDIACRIVESTIALLNDAHGQLVFLEKHNLCTLALLR